MTVDALMRNAPDFQSCHAADSAQRSRSAGVSFGRFTDRCRIPIWWRKARISNWSAARLRKEAESEAISAVNMCPNGNRTMSDNSQLINAIEVYESHKPRWDAAGNPAARCVVLTETRIAISLVTGTIWQ
jgi:hypothetical protein